MSGTGLPAPKAVVSIGRRRRKAVWLMAGLTAGLLGVNQTARGAFDQFETINVVGFGQVPTETNYVPNVVFQENGAASFEALKAQAVAARTFAYYKMRLSGIIQNGTQDQVYHKPSRGWAHQIHFDATDATEGEILSIRNFSGNDILIASFYVAGAIPSGPTPVPNPWDSDPTNTEQWVTHTYPTGVVGGNNLGTPLGFIGSPTNPNWPNRGAKSQNGANFMGNQGISYVDILKYYYGADIQLETVSPTPGQAPLQHLKFLTDFELNDGYLGNPTDFSNYNLNLGAATSIQRTAAHAHDGSFGQQINIDLDESAGSSFVFNHVAGTEYSGVNNMFTGEREANLALEPLGSIGFWLKTTSAGLNVGLHVDEDGDGTELAMPIDVIGDGQWHLYEWSLEDPALWSSGLYDGGDGALNNSITLDAITFSGNQDSVVYIDDLFWSPPGSGPAFPILGDIDGDGFVGIGDLNFLLARWNEAVPVGDHSQGDIAGNGDGFIGIDDLNVLLSNWNTGTPPAGTAGSPVPEPTTALLVLTGASLLMRRRSL